MAWLSFGALLIEATAIFFGLFSENEMFALNLEAAGPIIATLMWVEAVIVGAYLGVSVMEAMKK